MSADSDSGMSGDEEDGTTGSPLSSGSPTGSQIHGAINGQNKLLMSHRDSSGDEKPLDFSLKNKSKVKLQTRQSAPTDGVSASQTLGSGRSAFDAVSPHPGAAAVSGRGLAQTGLQSSLLQTGFPPFFNPALLAAVAAASGGSPLLPSPLLPSSFNPSAAAFLSNSLGFGALNHHHHHHHQQQQHHSDNGSSLPQSLDPETCHKDQSSGRLPQKTTRPFKAYNPTDPFSALQLSGAFLKNPNNNGGSAFAPATPPPTSQAAETFLAQYRQYLLNAQSALLRSNSSSDHELPPSSSSSSHPGSTTPSPPQVTSTSHPHTDGGLSPSTALDNPLLLKRLSSAPEPQASHVLASAPPAVIKKSLSVSSGKSISRKQQESAAHSPAAHRQEGDSPNSQRSATGRRRGRSLPEDMKDDAYWERRRKNNDAAKRSRDARRMKEDEIAMRAALLEQENLRLRLEVAQLKNETEKLRQMLLNT